MMQRDDQGLQVVDADGVIVRPEDIPAFDRTPDQVASLLARPFPLHMYRSRPVDGGKEVRYIPIGGVIERLNKAAPEWNWTTTRIEVHVLPIKRHGQLVDLPIVHVTGVLQIPGLGTRGAVGTAPAENNEDPAKIAESDAIKRAATMFGVPCGR